MSAPMPIASPAAALPISDEEADFHDEALDVFGTPPVPSWQQPRSFRQSPGALATAAVFIPSRNSLAQS